LVLVKTKTRRAKRAKRTERAKRTIGPERANMNVIAAPAQTPRS
jgi:hypothetical protein